MISDTTINNSAIVIGIRPGAIDSVVSGVTQPSPVSSRVTGSASSLSSHISASFHELLPYLTSPKFPLLNRYEEDVWPVTVKDSEDMPTVGFPKGWDEQEWEAKLEAERQAAAERERERREQSQQEKKPEPYSEPNYPGGDDEIDMPNPDSGDPGGPRSLDPYLYQPQPIFNFAKAIAATAIR
jgi:hypothetical protein